MRRLLTDNSSLPVVSPPQMSQKDDIIAVLAVLLCALICLLGLVVVSRCSWIRRLCGRISIDPSRGLKKKVLSSLPVFAFAEAEHVGKFVDCAICLSEYAAGDMIRLMPQCGHAYHVACIDTWLKSHKSCPSCRQILVTVRCEKCGAKDSPAGRGVSGPELQRTVTNHGTTFLP